MPDGCCAIDDRFQTRAPRRRPPASVPCSMGPHALPPLVPPLRFSQVEEGVYRGAYPSLVNQRFLTRLGLRTIVSLLPEPPTADLLQWCEPLLTRTPRGFPYCMCGLRVSASCVLYVPEAQGSLPRGSTTVHIRVPSSGVRTYLVPCGATQVRAARRGQPRGGGAAVQEGRGDPDARDRRRAAAPDCDARAPASVRALPRRRHRHRHAGHVPTQAAAVGAAAHRGRVHALRPPARRPALATRTPTWSKVPPPPLAAPQLGCCVPPQGTTGGSEQLGTPRERPVHRAPSHCLGCSS